MTEWKADGDVLDADEVNNMWYGEVGVSFGGDGTDGAYAPVGNESISGVKNYSSVQIDLARTILVGAGDWLIMKVTGNVNIDGILSADGKVVVGYGVGVLGSAPRTNNSSSPGGNGYNGGAGLGYGGGDISAPITNSPGFCGDTTIGLNIVKGRRGWFTGSRGWNAYGQGGGAILIECRGTVTIGGTITANGLNHANSGGGAGCIGIVSVGAFDGTGGTGTANGGNGTADGGGGGGCIVIISQGTITALGTMTVTAGTGGSTAGGAGQTSSEASSSVQYVKRPWAGQ